MSTNTRSNKSSLGRKAASVLIMAAFILLVWLIVIHPAAAGRTSNEEVHIQYISLQVEEGDTLWSIASAHLPSSEDIFHYMDHIRSVNHMHSDTIIADHYLIIPVYA